MAPNVSGGKIGLREHSLTPNAAAHARVTKVFSDDPQSDDMIVKYLWNAENVKHI